MAVEPGHHALAVLAGASRLSVRLGRTLTLDDAASAHHLPRGALT
jgi:hypothetical protein